MGIAIAEPHWAVNLLGAMRVEYEGRAVHLPRRQQRLVAVLAIRGRMHRRAVAATLWPDSPDASAALSVRVTLHQLQHMARGLVEREGDELRLGRVTVDADALCHCTGRLGQQTPTGPLSRSALSGGALLPGWDEEWLEGPRAHLGRHRLAALEHASAAQLACGNSEEALDLAEIAVSTDPLCESAHYLIVRAHLTAGNRARAIIAYQRLAETLRGELDVPPSLAFEEIASVFLTRSA